MIFGKAWRQHRLEAGWDVTLPGDWEARPGNTIRQAGCVAQQFVKNESWWFGAGTPLAVKAWVVCTDRDGSLAAVEQGLADAFRDLLDHSMRFPEFGSCREGEIESWVSDGAYQVSSLHDPKKVIFLRSLDRGRGLGLAVRVYQRKISHDRLRSIRLRFFGTAIRGN